MTLQAVPPAVVRTPVVLVTGLSGAGKVSTLRVLEDLGYEAVDNLPLTMLLEVVRRGSRPLALGIDIRTRGFDATDLLALVDGLRADPAFMTQLVFMSADSTVLLRRYTESRRRHPMSHGRVEDGIAEEIRLTQPLQAAADVVIDTSELPLPELRRLLLGRFAPAVCDTTKPLQVTLMSFAFPAGLPREADMVFDARFLRNPHYDPILRQRTGLDAEVAAYIEADPDYEQFFAAIVSLLDLVLPRFVQEGKAYVTIAVGCSGGRHRSVRTVERLLGVLQAEADSGGAPAWTTAAVHRELTKAAPPAMGTRTTTVPGTTTGGEAVGVSSPSLVSGKV